MQRLGRQVGRQRAARVARPGALRLAVEERRPVHEGHEASVWFLGVMTGWFVGHSEINLSSGGIKKIFLSLASLVIVFFGMVFISQFESSIQSEGLLRIIYSYSLGIFFSILVTWIIPRFWRSLKLAS